MINARGDILQARLHGHAANRGGNVRRIRLEKGLTQEQFADVSGFSQQYISGLESGKRNPTVVSLHDLAQALGVSPVDLIQPFKLS